MKKDYATAQARRIITGVDEYGKSCFVSDEETPVRFSSEANTKCEIWRTGTLPVPVDNDDGLEGGVYTEPNDGGVVYRIVTFRPDSEWDISAGFGDSHGPLKGMVPPEEAGGIVGLHVTDTVDIVTVLSGELTAVMETEETTLYPGDTLVQRGTKHSWNNRTTEPTTAAVLMISATR
ncbi:cupin domain-containing protein [Arthrobacter bambusae]|uniref:cupin domain-containing protein n=1 Tax=Arthrobacter bambusae TaxID=1338426 RepID=UPI001F5147CD|nr:cupin domain-containing protein [Arthrobacter bambusae]MCI0142607.1 cupin domain-containing protein [Arthrobacter bambusae]